MAEFLRFQHFEVPLREDGSPFELGRGAMGITYKAFDTNLRCHVALKVINAAYLSNEVARRRFLREARAAAALRHPNVATVFHLGEEGGNYFYAMEFVDGETVEALMKREGAIPAPTALGIVAQVARALGAAQKQGLVHRDIKPSNLMLVPEDDGEFTVKVIDFGLAKSSAGAGEDMATLTVAGFLGTPHFASPEQLEERDLDVRSDIYSLGATLYYMLAGRVPFSGSLAQVMSQHLHREPPLETLAGQQPEVLILLRHMLAKDPGARPQTPSELRRETEVCQQAVKHSADPVRQPSTESADTFETQALEAPLPSGLVEPAPGVILADCYRILREAGNLAAGKMFRAEVVESGEPVAVVLIDSSLTASAEACTRLEDRIMALQKQSPPALQRILSIERLEHISFLTMEWVEGPSLLDVMRARKALPMREALVVLRPLAAAFDALAAAAVPCPDVSSHEVLLPGTDVSLPLAPDSAVKFPVIPDGASAASPDATMIASPLALLREGGAFGGNESRACVFVLASLAYEILGGIRSGASGGVVPIAGLSESANSALRRGLKSSSAGYPSCAVFLDAIQGIEVPGIEEEPGVQEWEQPSEPPPDVLLPPVIPQAVGGPGRTTIFLKPALLTMAVTVTVLAAGGGLFLTRPSTVDGGPTPRPVSMTPPSPTPAPDPVDAEMKKILGASDANPAETLSALLALAQRNQARPEIPMAITEWIVALKGKSRNLPAADALLLRIPLEAAASGGFPDAATVLGELNRKSDPAGALKWFLAAADQGKPDAMVRAGQMIASGKGVTQDRVAGARWFQRAADLQDASALFCLGECYLHGEGVARDPARAVQLLSASAAKNNPSAMNLLGDLYKKGLNSVITPNFTEAFRLFSDATELGNLDAQGNLGVLCMNGQGVEQNEARAVGLFRDGAEKGNPTCMFFYAMTLENGTSGAPSDAGAAKSWYLRAAQAGHVPAINWCREHGIPVGGAGAP